MGLLPLMLQDWPLSGPQVPPLSHLRPKMACGSDISPTGPRSRDFLDKLGVPIISEGQMPTVPFAPNYATASEWRKM
jgi:hypothetical protein